MTIKCKGCHIWERSLYTGCMFTPTTSDNTECPCVKCIVKSMCNINSHSSCSRFDDYLKEVEDIIYD